MDLSEPQRLAAREAARRQPIIEPPVIERAASLVYAAIGREDLRLARFLSVAAWLAGAFALWWLTARLFGGSSAAIATALAVYLFVPFGIPASQALQPDALMTALTVLAVAAAVHHDRGVRLQHDRGVRLQPDLPGPPEGGRYVRPEGGRYVRALAFLTLASAAAIFIKPMAGFFVFPVVLVLAIRRLGWLRGALFTAGLTILAIAPAAWWYVFIAPDAADNRLFPALLATPAFWRGWLKMVDAVVTWPLAAAGLAAVALTTGRARTVLLALWVGYLLLGAAFTYHIHTHNYYSLPLVPFVALSIAGAVARAQHAMSNTAVRRVAAVAGALAIAAGATVSAHVAGVFRPTPDADQRAADFARIGSLVEHSRNVTSLDGDYGFSLNYYGYLATSNLPLSIDRALGQLSGVAPPTPADVVNSLSGEFFVATLQPEVDGFGDMRRLLDERYPLIERGGTAERWRYVVYDLRRPKLSVTPQQVSFFALASGAASSAGQVALWAPPGLRWRAEPAEPLFDIQPAEGAGPATLQLVPRPGVPDTDRTVDVRIFSAGASTPAVTFAVRFRSFAALPSSAPMGSVDGPGEPVTFDGAPVTFQGWALDAFDLRRVRVEITDARGRVRTIGETHGVWKRPDVAAIVPNGHDIFNSGWAFVLQPEMLTGTASPVTIRFFAETGDGRAAEIGKRTVLLKDTTR